MRILRRLGAATVTAPAAIAVIGLIAGLTSPATWSVKPGGAYTAASTRVEFTVNSVSVTCTSSTANGTFKSGGGLAAQNIGGISLAFSDCTGPLGAVTVTGTGFPWQINAVSYDLDTDTATLQIANINADVSMTDCSFTVSGPSTGTDNGTVEVKYTNPTGKAAVQHRDGNNLQVNNVSGCDGVVSNGETVTYAATYKLTPIQTIASP